ncbi:hypothetical protein JTE90_002588 [Oedothorax gibbosus]|uniref:Uncharacterized protein n=1 Tax=Oedothorax gibbosus TaxID=931172 RepID=A0AAV6V424_9ARAC|nr:hypothetical protein JTE90_002588 [Oedothorax gibbosus]
MSTNQSGGGAAELSQEGIGRDEERELRGPAARSESADDPTGTKKPSGDARQNFPLSEVFRATVRSSERLLPAVTT